MEDNKKKLRDLYNAALKKQQQHLKEYRLDTAINLLSEAIAELQHADFDVSFVPDPMPCSETLKKQGGVGNDVISYHGELRIQDHLYHVFFVRGDRYHNIICSYQGKDAHAAYVSTYRPDNAAATRCGFWSVNTKLDMYAFQKFVMNTIASIEAFKEQDKANSFGKAEVPTTPVFNRKNNPSI